MWWSWKNWFWTVSSLEGCGGSSGGLERTDFEQFQLWDRVVVFKALILNNFYFGRVWWSWKNWFWTVSTLGGCGGLERTDFEQFLLLGVVWWSWKDWFWTVSTLGQGVVVLKELILNSFYFGRVWWSWQNWFWTVSTLGGCGGLKRTDFEQFLTFGQGVVVIKELILKTFYFGRVRWSWKNWLWTVSTLEGCGGRCGGLERTNFEQFLLWDSVVVLKELILNSFYFGRVWWSWKNWFLTVSTLGGCGGLERTDFEQFLLLEGVVVLKELILNSFYFGRVWGRCGGLERTDFEQFLLWDSVVVLKELILNSFYLGKVW